MANRAKPLLISSLIWLAGSFCESIVLRPPATPLVVQSPFLSIWSTGDSLSSNYSRHWTDEAAPLYSVISIDGESYRLMGAPYNNLPGTVHDLPQVTATTTTYHFPSVGDKISLNLSFVTPSLLDNVEYLSLPCTYLKFDVSSKDDQHHNVSIYFDTDAELVAQTSSAKMSWERVSMNQNNNHSDVDIVAMRLGQATQKPVASSGDYVKIDWGWWMLLTDTSHLSGSALANRSIARSIFEQEGNIANVEDDQGNNRQATDGYISMCLSFELGLVDGESTSSAWLALLLDEVVAVNYYGQDLPPYWRRNLTLGDASVVPTDLLQFVNNERLNIFQECYDFDLSLQQQLSDVGLGEEYVKIAELSYRQVTGGLSLAWNPNTQNVWYFLKEISTNGDISTIDLWWPASSMLLSLQPQLMVYALRPLLYYMNNETTSKWPYLYCAHDLGTWPIADRKYSAQEYMPIETTSDMLYMFAATVKLYDEDDFLSSELFNYWQLVENWGEYLLQENVLPYPASQKSTTDWQGAHANTTQLMSKGIIGLGCYAYLLMLKGDIDKATDVYTTAAMYVSVWTMDALVDQGSDGLHAVRQLQENDASCEGDKDSWSLQYSLFEQDIFNFNFFDKDKIISPLLNYYGGNSQVHTYGIPQDCTTNTVGGPTWLTMMSAAGFNLANELFDEKKGTKSGSWHNTSQLMISKLFKFVNETDLRLPMVDFHNTDTAGPRVYPSQRARPAVGAIFTPLLVSQTMLSFSSR